MERDGQLLANRKGELCVVAKLDLVVGIVQGHPDGFGFLVPEDGGDDYFLNAREMHKVLHGDRAVVRMSGVDRRGRPEGEIVEVLTRANVEVVGRLHEERGMLFHRRREPADQPGFPGPARRHRRRDDRPGRRGRDRRAAGAQPRAGRARQGGAGQRHRSRHRDRDRAAQACAAVRVFEGSGAPGQAPSRRGAPGRPQGPRRPDATCRSSPSTARPRRTSTTPCTASARARASG